MEAMSPLEWASYIVGCTTSAATAAFGLFMLLHTAGVV